MNDNINPEVNEELNDTEVTSEELNDAEVNPEEVNDTEITEAVDDQEFAAQDADALEAEQEAAEAVEAAEALVEDDNTLEEPGTLLGTDAIAEDSQEELAEPVKTKKKFPIQIPVIIAACIVLAAILGYLVFIFFFYNEPEATTWASDVEGATYYYEFKNDGVFKGYVGSVELTGTYEKEKGEDGNSLTLSSTFGSFYGGYPCTYTITGSKILGNMEMNCSYGEGYDSTLTQAKREQAVLDVSEDFVPDEALIGSWIFSYMGYDVYKVTFDDKGYMSLEFLQQGIKYNGTYTLEDGKINFTYVISENVTAPGEYSVDGDVLNFMGYSFVREGSDAQVASDDQIAVPTE